MSRIFIDVGAHYGETLHVALDPAWGFDRIYAIEPTSACQPVLRKFKDRRLVIEQIALSDHDGQATIYGAGLLGGSLFAQKRQIATSVEKVVNETVRLKRASDWFAENVPQGASVFLKMNCEGAEAEILSDLLDSGEIDRVTHLYVDFDIRKVEGEQHRQAEIEGRLKARGISYIGPDAFTGTPDARISQWLSERCVRVVPSAWERVRFRFKLYAPSYMHITALIRSLMPTKLYWWLGRRYGRLARMERRQKGDSFL